MATSNGSKKYSVEVTPANITDVLAAFAGYTASIERSIEKESDDEVKAVRRRQLERVRATRDLIAYGGKELV